jgi:hypothetical protein
MKGINENRKIWKKICYTFWGRLSVSWISSRFLIRTASSFCSRRNNSIYACDSGTSERICLWMTFSVKRLRFFL